MSDAEIFDQAFLAGLSGGDTEFEDEILSLFLDNAASYLDELEAARDADEWQKVAHKFKGAARAVGAIELAALGEAAEPITDAGKRQAMLDRLRAAHDAFAAHLGKSIPAR